MKNFRLHTFPQKSIPAFCAFLISVFSFASISGQNEWHFGKNVMLIAPNAPLSPLSKPWDEPLKVPFNGFDDLNNIDFVNQVGGVAFHSVAMLDSNMQQGGLILIYDPKNEDGKRLNVAIGRDTLTADLFDWQLIPIAKYADSEFQSCVSLFGPNSTESAYHVVYHPAFQNTLLGVRLINADILLIDLSQFWKVPTFGGKPILGAGESMPSESQWVRHAMNIQSDLIKKRFQSYVFTDYGEHVVIGRSGKQLAISGLPYYYFWTADAWGQKVIPVAELTQLMKNRRTDIEAFNPLVYRAATNTMRYSALFRYAKQKNLLNWKAFLKSIEKAPVTPSVKTPVLWDRG